MDTGEGERVNVIDLDYYRDTRIRAPYVNSDIAQMWRDNRKANKAAEEAIALMQDRAVLAEMRRSETFHKPRKTLWDLWGPKPPKGAA